MSVTPSPSVSRLSEIEASHSSLLLSLKSKSTPKGAASVPFALVSLSESASKKLVPS